MVFVPNEGRAMEKIKLQEPRLSRVEFARRSQEYLNEAQKVLMPEQAAKFIAINMVTGEYVLGDRPGKASAAFQARWPDHLFFLCRVDGGPAYKFYGK